MYYNGAHSIKFAPPTIAPVTYLEYPYDTWTTWGLIPTKQPTVAAPPPRTKYIDIPGRHGQLDISDILTGSVLMDNRTGSWEFYVYNPTRHLDTLYSEIISVLHGKKMNILLTDDLDYKYVGRLTVGDLNIEKNDVKLSISYTIEPFKEDSKISNKTEGWQWDPFNFEIDRIQNIQANPQIVATLDDTM